MSATTERPSSSPHLPFVQSLFERRRRRTREVLVGSVGVGGNNPIRIQSMTTTPTTDVEATVAQSIRMIQAGCEIVRITAPKIADAKALGPIRQRLNELGYARVPLVADIHFNPECAMEAANHVEKIRVNPGNYADSKAFRTVEYSDAQYDAELVRIEEKFTPLLLKCKARDLAMRIGCNHGSLSDRIMNRYGDTPEGMVEAALEFVRICRKHDYHKIVLSMKASNPKVMIAAYRLLVARMNQEDMDYPLHLGVTEAGYGEDGRIKSAIGIGSLLNDGIGDTVRVSLTEDPEFEMPVAVRIAAPYQAAVALNGSGGQTASSARPPHVASFYRYARRPATELNVGPFRLGADHPIRVFTKAGGTDGKAAALAILALLEAQLKTGKDTVPEIIDWTVDSPAALQAFKDFRRALGGETSRLAFLARFSTLSLAQEGLPSAHVAEGPQVPAFWQAAKAAGVPVLLEESRTDGAWLEPAERLLENVRKAEREGVSLLLSLRLPSVERSIANVRAVAAAIPSGWPIHLAWSGSPTLEEARIDASIFQGSLLCDGIGDSAEIHVPGAANGAEPAFATRNPALELLYNVLQGAGVRITKTEFISCPSCGRTLFDLQTVTERIKQKTGHLKGVKIAIMGCIVNGPGEMADADFGYVGGAPGKINLYVGKTCVEKGIDFDQADDRLIQLIKAHHKWVDPISA